jgi:hypothetical protein
MQHRKSGFGEVVDLVLVGLLDVGTDEHEFLDAEVRECLPDACAVMSGAAAGV